MLPLASIYQMQEGVSSGRLIRSWSPGIPGGVPQGWHFLPIQMKKKRECNDQPHELTSHVRVGCLTGPQKQWYEVDLGNSEAEAKTSSSPACSL